MVKKTIGGLVIALFFGVMSYLIFQYVNVEKKLANIESHQKEISLRLIRVESNPTATDEKISKLYSDIGTQLKKEGYPAVIATEGYSLDDIRIDVMLNTQYSQSDSQNVKQIINNVANNDGFNPNGIKTKVDFKSGDN